MIIAIDGFSSTGKSTLAKDLAKVLGIAYVDTGAMYRAVTYYMILNSIDLDDDIRINEMLDSIDIDFRRVDGMNTTFLDDVNIEEHIRGKEVSNLVSPVATLGLVRDRLVDLQRAMALDTTGLVMDGRDIGTVVFPKADFKFFINSSILVRAQRRYEELIAKGHAVSLEEVSQNLTSRDSIDSSRAHSPLRKATDAVEIDNTSLSKEQQLALLLDYIHKGKPSQNLHV